MAPSPDDPTFVPHLHGERTPYLDAGLRGAWTNLDRRHDRSYLLRAALEGVAFAIRDALQHVVHSSDGVIHLRLAGGGTTDPAWQPTLADILATPLPRSTSPPPRASALPGWAPGPLTSPVSRPAPLRGLDRGCRHSTE